MGATDEEMVECVVAVVTRWETQRAGPSSDEVAVRALARRLAAVVAERGLPRPAGNDQQDSPPARSEAEIAQLAERVAGEGATPLLAEVARQLVKACFYPEKPRCCESYREVSADGSCRRQELARTRGRISGSYCVDCPHWTTLTPTQQAVHLAAGWRGEVALLAAHEGVFLPADFRALRGWVHAAARR